MFQGRGKQVGTQIFLLGKTPGFTRKYMEILGLQLQGSHREN